MKDIDRMPQHSRFVSVPFQQGLCKKSPNRALEVMVQFQCSRAIVVRCEHKHKHCWRISILASGNSFIQNFKSLSKPNHRNPELKPSPIFPTQLKGTHALHNTISANTMSTHTQYTEMLGVPEKVQKKKLVMILNKSVNWMVRCGVWRDAVGSDIPVYQRGRQSFKNPLFNPINVHRYVIHGRGNRKGSCVHVSAGEHGEHWPGCLSGRFRVWLAILVHVSVWGSSWRRPVAQERRRRSGTGGDAEQGLWWDRVKGEQGVPGKNGHLW